jgi:hypothetical protein
MSRWASNLTDDSRFGLRADRRFDWQCAPERTLQGNDSLPEPADNAAAARDDGSHAGIDNDGDERPPRSPNRPGSPGATGIKNESHIDKPTDEATTAESRYSLSIGSRAIRVGSRVILLDDDASMR